MTIIALCGFSACSLTIRMLLPVATFNQEVYEMEYAGDWHIQKKDDFLCRYYICIPENLAQKL